jgi:hypothetical protein
LVTVEEQCEAHLEKKLEFNKINPGVELLRQCAQGDRAAFNRFRDLDPHTWLCIAQKASSLPGLECDEDEQFMMIAKFSGELLAGLEQQRKGLEEELKNWDEPAVEEFRKELLDRLNISEEGEHPAALPEFSHSADFKQIKWGRDRMLSENEALIVGTLYTAMKDGKGGVSKQDLANALGANGSDPRDSFRRGKNADLWGTLIKNDRQGWYWLKIP